MKLNYRHKEEAFTIVELIISVVIIAIIAGISYVSYVNISSQARIAVVKSELGQLRNQLDIFKVENNGYPYSVDDLIDFSQDDVEIYYTAHNESSPPDYCLTAIVLGQSFTMSRLQALTEGACSEHMPVVPVISAEANSTSQITVSWDEIYGSISYRLEYADNSQFTSSTSIDDIIDGVYQIEGLDSDTEYWVRVFAINGLGESPASNAVSARTIMLSPSGSPVLSVAVNSTSQITVSWGSISGATSYILEYSLQSNFSSPATINDITGTSRAVTGLTSGTTYYFRGYAVNEGGTSAVSSSVSATTTIAAPTSVSVELSETAGAADYTATCAPGTTAQFRYATTHRTDGSTADSWGSFGSWSTTASNTDFISQGMYGRVLVEARCQGSSGGVSASRYAKSAGEINQSTSGISGSAAFTIPNSTSSLGNYATGTAVCPNGLSAYVQLSLRTRSSGGENRGQNNTNTAAASGATTATARTPTSSNGSGGWYSGELGTRSGDIYPGYPANANNWVTGRKMSVLSRCQTSYITWRQIRYSSVGSANNTTYTAAVALGITSITDRPEAESNLTSY